ncbi:MAG TPA: transglycosylase SLT domain-containing protein [Candidatus Saccharimonadia bacterium]|nr:transglycosylase SLT domain-containing protein [Candidatus Saccharimonadia bacterium]
MKSLLTLVATAALVACAQGPAARETARAGRIDDAKVDTIYRELASASAMADDALAKGRDGDPTAASHALTTAREALTAAGGRCVDTPGCEIERVLAAQDALIERQSRALLGADDSTAPTDEEVTAEAGGRGSPIVRSMPQAGRAVSLLKGKDLRSVIRLNDAVKASIEEWLTWMRPNLLEAYENYQYMRHRMWPEYEKAGLPEALLFGILAKESGGKVHAVSRAGASGPLQFMPHTGVRYGLGQHGGFDQRFDPTAATRANVAYLNDQFRVLNNNLELALGAYNGGEGRMQRLSPGGRRPFWDNAVLGKLPPETREYVPMVLAAAWLYLHPEEYNLTFPIIDAEPAKVTLAQSLSINEIAVCIGQAGNERGWFRTLRNLNPRYDANVRIARGTALELPKAAVAGFQRNCSGGRLLATAMELHDAKPPIAPAWRAPAAASRTHVVRRGETLSSIARKFRCGDVRRIAQANRIKAPGYSIRVGQRIVVPACSA